MLEPMITEVLLWFYGFTVACHHKSYLYKDFQMQESGIFPLSKQWQVLLVTSSTCRAQVESWLGSGSMFFPAWEDSPRVAWNLSRFLYDTLGWTDRTQSKIRCSTRSSSKIPYCVVSVAEAGKSFYAVDMWYLLLDSTRNAVRPHKQFQVRLKTLFKLHDLQFKLVQDRMKHWSIDILHITHMRY